ncbi:MAG: hypothetical protein WA880_00820 [Ornithinimicrobium sp.]
MVESRRVLIASTSRDRGALAAVRALGRAGWVVGVGTPEGGGVLGSSRYCQRTHQIPRPRHDARGFIDGVTRAATQGDYQIAFGGNDDWMAALSAYRDELPIQVVHPRYPVVQGVLDKIDIAEAARQVGLSYPHTVLATSTSVRHWKGPVVVKCRAHWHPGQTRPHRIDARQFASSAAAQPQIDLITDAGGIPILQRPVDGDLGAIIGLMRSGRLHARVQQESLRLWPTPHGMSARARTVAVDPSLALRSQELLRALDWHGLVELQFLTDARGESHLIDINGRFYGSLALAERARPGLIDAWAQTSLSEYVPYLPDGRHGLRYSWWAGDLRRAKVERRHGLLADLAHTLISGLAAQHSVWDLRDMAPAWQLTRERFVTPANEVSATTSDGQYPGQAGSPLPWTRAG